MRKGVHLSMFFILFFVSFAMAQIPQTMSYQGVLTGTDGNPVADGTVSLTFKLYDVAADGAALWEETQNIAVNNGIFNAILGSVTTLNLPFDKQYWLGIAVGQDVEMAPRITLSASPYSLGATATVTEPAAGQSFVVRNAAGTATHALSANGDVTHAGTGTFLGGIVVGDTVIVPIDTLGASGPGQTALKKTSGNKNATNLPAIGLNSPGTQIGVFGISPGSGRGVFGFSTSGDGVNGFSTSGIGVNGSSDSGSGVKGFSTSGDGVSGESTSGAGVEGFSISNSGVSGSSVSNSGVKGFSTSGDGVNGFSTSGDGVSGSSDSNSGVSGSSTSGAGVKGFSSSSDGVNGFSTRGSGVVGISVIKAGVVGRGNPAGWFQGKLKVDDVPAAPNQERFLVWDADSLVKYRNLPGSGGGGWLVDPQNNYLVSTGHDVLIQDALGTVTTRFNADGTSLHKGDETFEGDVILKGTNGKGIKLVDAAGTTLAGFGRVDLDTGQNIGVFAKAQNPGDLAAVFEGPVDVLGEITASSLHIVNTAGDSLTDFFADGTSRHRGLETYEAGIAIVNSDGSTAIDLQPNTDPNTQYALTINGNIMVNGLLQATSKDFRIDHPLDPENKYLTHTSVESPDMKTVYDGVVLLDDHGESRVELPEWFQALNGDFRYQLTCIGGFAQVYIAEEIQNNRFRIAGGTPGMKVSWQVTGIRHDAWAQEHRQPVEGYK